MKKQHYIDMSLSVTAQSTFVELTSALISVICVFWFFVQFIFCSCDPLLVHVSLALCESYAFLFPVFIVLVA